MIVKKHQTDVSHLENSIMGMHSKDITTRDIDAKANEIYRMDVSPTLISNITDKVIPLVK